MMSLVILLCISQISHLFSKLKGAVWSMRILQNNTKRSTEKKMWINAGLLRTLKQAFVLSGPQLCLSSGLFFTRSWQNRAPFTEHNNTKSSLLVQWWCSRHESHLGDDGNWTILTVTMSSLSSSSHWLKSCFKKNIHYNKKHLTAKKMAS